MFEGINSTCLVLDTTCLLLLLACSKLPVDVARPTPAILTPGLVAIALLASLLLSVIFGFL